jgi:hypothetical protein
MRRRPRRYRANPTVRPVKPLGTKQLGTVGAAHKRFVGEYGASGDVNNGLKCVGIVFARYQARFDSRGWSCNFRCHHRDYAADDARQRPSAKAAKSFFARPALSS